MPEEGTPSQDHNLVNQIKVNGFNWRNYVPLTFEVLAIFFALLFGYFYREYLAGNQVLPSLFTFLAFYLIFSGTLTILSQYILRRMGVAALEALAAITAFFFDRPISTILIVWVALFVFLAWGIARTREDMATNVKIKFLSSFKHQLNKLVTGLTLMVLLLYLPQAASNPSGTFFSQGAFQKTFLPVSEFASKLYPEFNVSPTSTVEGAAESIALAQLSRNAIFNDLPEAAKQAAIQESVNSVLGSLQQNFGGGVQKNDSLTTAFYKAIISRLRDWRDRFGNGFLVFWAIIIFLLIRSLGAVTAWVSLILAYGLYELLIVLKIIRIGEEHRTVEILEYV